MTAVLDDLEADLEAILAMTPAAAVGPTWREIIAQDIEELRATGSLAGTFLDDSTVNDDLTADSGWPGPGHCWYCWAPLRRRRRNYCSAQCRRDFERETRQTDNEAYRRAVIRMIRGHGRRVAQNDLAGLSGLADVMAEAEAAMQAAVNGLRERGVSWSEIGRELDVSKQAAQQRWGRSA